MRLKHGVIFLCILSILAVLFRTPRFRVEENAEKKAHPSTEWRPEYSLPFDETWDFKRFASGFECQLDTWCDTFFDPAETERTQEYLYNLQNPKNCSAARFLVMPTEYYSGLGSSLNIRKQLMSLSVASNRTLIIPSRPMTTWAWADLDVCGEDRGLQDCWFEPISHCDLDRDAPNWQNAPNAGERFRLNDTTRVLQLVQLHVGLPEWYGRNRYIPPQFSHKDRYWWFAQLAKFMIRPNPRTLQIVSDMQKEVFPPSGVMPHPIVSVYVRHGDKQIETPSVNFSSYMDMIIPVAQKHNIKNIYLGTDDPHVIEEAEREHTQFKFHYIKTERYDNPDYRILSMLDATPERLMNVSLSDLFMQIQGDMFVGTRTSNWCALIDELRKANGKARVPYLSPEKDSFLTQW